MSSIVISKRRARGGKMNKLGLFSIVFFALVLSPVLFAATEKSFADAGYSDFIVDGKNQTQCSEYIFLNQGSADQYPILSIKAEFFPVLTGAANIKIYLNDKEIQSLTTKNFVCKEYCSVRAVLNKEDLLAENKLKICTSTSNSITKATVLADSTIGFYETPLFSIPDFKKSVGAYNFKFGQTLPVTLKLKNSGSKEANVDVNYMRNLLESEHKSYNIMGDSYFSGVIKPGEEKTFEYVIKPLRSGVITIIPSSVEYFDVFGDKQVMLSNVVEINVEESTKLIGEIIIDKSKAKLGESVKATIALKNISASKITSVELKVLKNGSEIGSFDVGELNPNQTTYEDIYISSDIPATSTLTCAYEYGEESDICNSVSVVFEREELSWAWIQSFIIILLGVLVFGGLYLYITESGKPKDEKQKSGQKK